MGRRSVRAWLTAVLVLSMVAAQLPAQMFRSGTWAAAAGGAIGGHVSGANGPLANVTVRVSNASGGALMGSATTDAAGAYNISIATPGSYNLSFTPPKGSGYAVQVYPDQVSTATAQPISVAAAQVTVDAVLRAAYPASGLVTDTAGKPVPNVPVAVYLADDACCYFIRGDTTDAVGAYSIDLAPGHTYKIRFADGRPYEQWYNARNNPGNDTVIGWSAADGFTVDPVAAPPPPSAAPSAPAPSAFPSGSVTPSATPTPTPSPSSSPLNLGTGGHPNTNAVLRLNPRVAYIAGADTAVAADYKSLLDASGWATDIIPKANILSIDFAQYARIVIGPDTNSWGGSDQQQATYVDGSLVPIVGIGFGGSSFFDAAGRTSIGWLQSWIWTASGDCAGCEGVGVVDPTDRLWTTPFSVAIPTSGVVALYKNFGSFVAVHAPLASEGITRVGRQPAPDQDHYTLMRDGTRYFLWGYNGGPTAMTTAGTSAFVNAISEPSTVVERRGFVSGVAKCDDPRNAGSYMTLAGAHVALLSGLAEVAKTDAGADGSYGFTGTAPLTTFGIRYTSVDGKITCAVSVNTDGKGNATAPLPQLSLHNGTWTTAYRLAPRPAPGTSALTLYSQTDYLFAPGQSHWFKFSIKPGQKVLVKLVGANGTVSLPADYSLALFKDIQKYFVATRASLVTDPLGTVARQDASTAPDALSPDALSPDALSPDALSPDALSPDALSPDALSPDALSPDELSPDELSPDALSPDALSPDALSPDALSPDALSPDAYSGAQTATILRVSAHQGNSPEQVRQNTWTNTGDFYVRVRGHNGAFAPADAFTLIAEVVDSACVGVTLNSFNAATPAPATGAAGRQTLILTNSGRIDLAGYPQGSFGSPTAAFLSKLASFADRPDVNGVVVDLASDAGLAGAYAQWIGDGTASHPGNPTCPAAANILAEGIRQIVDARRPYGLRYVVLVGGDGVIPYYRSPDQAGLGNESMYQPGVRDDSASKSSLAFGFVLTQDFYVGQRLQRGDHEYFKPELPIGRLVESATDAAAVIDAYTAVNGVVQTTSQPGSLLDTGYDFLADTAHYVKDTLGPAVARVDTLITEPAPNNANPWTAAELRALLTARHYTIAALNGHFSANSALAADYATRLLPTDLVPTLGLLTNTLVLSTGCHSGYNIYNADALATTQSLDFPQVFARAGATLIGGTGYQYGDTDFRKYSELILGNVALELTYGTGPVTIGFAHLNSKLSYLASLASMRGIDEKAIEESTLYGLPMWSIDLAAGRTSRPGSGAAVPQLGAGSLLTGDVTPTYALSPRTTSVGTYYDAGTVGAPSVSVSPGLPVQPFVATDVRSLASGYVPRGVVLLDTTYVDEGPVTPFTSAVGTEVGVVHPGFASTVFAPVRPFGLNKLSGSILTVTPTQYKTTTFNNAGAPGNAGTLRRWTDPSFRVYYSSSADATSLSAAPVIYQVTLAKTVAGKLQVDVTLGAAVDPGIAALYVNYTVPGATGGHWSHVLVGNGAVDQASQNGPIAEAVAPATGTPTALTRTYRTVITPGVNTPAESYQVFVQAVGGNGLVSLSTNGGAYFTYAPPAAVAPLAPATPKTETVLTLTTHEARYLGTTMIDVAAAGANIEGLPIVVALGGRHKTVTIAAGAAHVSLPVDDLPGTNSVVTATVNEDATHLPATAQGTIRIGKARSQLSPISGGATVLDGTQSVVGRLILGISQDGQVVQLGSGKRSASAPVDGYGRIRLDAVALHLPKGPAVLHAVYAGNDIFEGSSADLPVFIVKSVEGGGWITVPADATGLTARTKANFGFTAKFDEDASTPSGNVEFTSKESNLTFKATKLESLVVVGMRAQIDGTGTVNGGGAFRFRLIVTDGSPDTFEIRIWSTSGSSATPRYGAAASISGGSIEIH